MAVDEPDEPVRSADAELESSAAALVVGAGSGEVFDGAARFVSAGGAVRELVDVDPRLELQAVSSRTARMGGGLQPRMRVGDMAFLVCVGRRVRPAVLSTAVVDAHRAQQRPLRMTVLRHLQDDLSGKNRFCRVLLDFVQTLHRNAAIDASHDTN